MTDILSGIYGTHGMEKVASADAPQTLSDLALAMVVDGSETEDDLVKVASDHTAVLGQLGQFDRAGRAMAHHEFADMEKQAHAGDFTAINEFFEEPEELDEREMLRQAVISELETRLAT